MATKKSTKKTAVKKAVKKPTKKVTKKRSYNRKPKPDADVGLVEGKTAQSTGADQGQPDRAGDDQMDSIGSFGEFLSKVLGVEGNAGSPEPGAESPLELLRQIEVLDMRDVSIKDRFHTLLLLESLGYITTSVESLITLDNLRVGLMADALSLNHDNKLVRPMFWEEVEACDCEAISKPTVNCSKINLGFTLPEPAYPDETSIGKARYVRVG